MRLPPRGRGSSPSRSTEPREEARPGPRTRPQAASGSLDSAEGVSKTGRLSKERGPQRTRKAQAQPRAGPAIVPHLAAGRDGHAGQRRSYRPPKSDSKRESPHPTLSTRPPGRDRELAGGALMSDHKPGDKQHRHESRCCTTRSTRGTATTRASVRKSSNARRTSGRCQNAEHWAASRASLKPW